MTNQQLAEAMLKALGFAPHNPEHSNRVAAILPLINERVKEAKGEAWDAAEAWHADFEDITPDRETYLNQ